MHADLRPAREQAETILAGGQRAGSDSALAAALATLSVVAWNDSYVDDALGLVRPAIKRSDQGPVEGRRLYPRFWFAAMLTALGEFDEAELIIKQGAQEIEGQESEGAADAMGALAPSVFRARLCLAAGRLDEAVTEAERALMSAEELETILFVPIAEATLAAIALQRGDIRQASLHVGHAQAAPMRALFGPATYLLLQSRVAQAGANLSEATGPAAVAHGVDRALLVEDPTAAAFLVRTALAAGGRRVAEALVAGAETIAAQGTAYPSLVAAAAHARGLLERNSAALELAAARHRHPWAEACATEDAGVLRADSGHRAEATGWWEHALACYEDIGATRDAARVRAWLRDVRFRRGRWHNVWAAHRWLGQPHRR